MTNQFEIFDERFKSILLPDSKLEKLASGAVWSEGPVYLEQDQSLIWSNQASHSAQSECKYLITLESNSF